MALSGVGGAPGCPCGSGRLVPGRLALRSSPTRTRLPTAAPCRPLRSVPGRSPPAHPPCQLTLPCRKPVPVDTPLQVPLTGHLRHAPVASRQCTPGTRSPTVPVPSSEVSRPRHGQRSVSRPPRRCPGGEPACVCPRDRGSERRRDSPRNVSVPTRGRRRSRRMATARDCVVDQQERAALVAHDLHRRASGPCLRRSTSRSRRVGRPKLRWNTGATAAPTAAGLARASRPAKF